MMSNISLTDCMIQGLLEHHYVNEVVNQIIHAEYCSHYLIVYPDLTTLREMYSQYIQRQIKYNNEIILINPFYETTDSVRQILSKSGVNISEYEKEKELVIIDSLKEYFGSQPDILFKRNLVNYAKQMGKNGLSIIGDIGGAYTHKSKHNELVVYELSLPTKFDVDMKGFCLYHEKDFNKFSDKQKQQLIKHHGNALKIE
ncbi:MAG TPA: MEDS domain-containing protein [Nitrososphaeraceae archaeon]